MKHYRRLLLFGLIILVGWSQAIAQHSVARRWNDALLNAIRKDLARPTVHARNLFHTSIAMYDAWAAYDTLAKPFLLGKTVGNFTCPFNGVPVPADLKAARNEAISYAAYRVLKHRFQNSPNAVLTGQQLDALMLQLGYDASNVSTNYSSGSPAALGNYIAQCIIAFGLQDGSNEANNYANQFYQPVNPPLVIKFAGNPDILDPNRWQPITLDVFIDQSGNVIPYNTPPFLSPEWGTVVPFSLKPADRTIYQRNGHEYWVYHDPGPPPSLDTTGMDNSEAYKWNFSLVSAWSGHLHPSDSVLWDISPASRGNIQKYPTNFQEMKDFYNLEEGGDPGTGYSVNPKTGMPYEPQIVPRGDYARVLAEFWADGPSSETPPGHWFTILNYVNDHPLFQKRFRGKGPVLDDLEWDVKAYLMLGGAMHDVAITAWGIKGWYDYIRPVSAIRKMADLGQSTDPALPHYHPAGIPLIPGRIELVTAGDSLAGMNDVNVGKIKLFAWRGPNYVQNPQTDVAGTGWILAENWWPYQRPSFVTPPFAGYISGHSTYSRAGAELLTMLTGDPFFPGGMGVFPAPQNQFLVFEDGPSVDVTLQWATYRDASDQCSLSRIWGGIHPPADDMPGRFIGAVVGVEAFHYAESYFYRDEDHDGYYSDEDCDDHNPNVYPGAPELCDGLDNDCDGMIDDSIPVYTYYRDSDNDTYGDAAVSMDTCLTPAPAGFVDNSLDCDDTNPDIHPGAAELCDGIDNDCNGMVDDGITVYTYYRDSDNDTYGDAAVSMDTCLTPAPAGFVDNSLDCDDTNADIHPGAAELCDGIDNDCNGMVDDGITVYTYYRDSDNDTYGDAAVSMDTCLTPAPAGFVENSLDCDDTNPDIHPGAAELCDGIDNDCNGMVDDGITVYTYYRDSDNDTYGDAAVSMDTCLTPAPAGFVDNSLDCDDTNPDIHPGAAELCDGVDNDCNGTADDGLAVFTYYRDNDNDTYGDAMAKIDTCLSSPPTGFVTDNTDCDDNNAAINPGAVEVFDGLDNDCNGLIDDGVVSVDLLAGKSWKLYPNPANGVVYLEMNVAEPLIARLVSPEGQLMRETTLHFVGGTASITLESLPPGIYFVVLSGQNGKPQMLGKIVKL